MTLVKCITSTNYPRNVMFGQNRNATTALFVIINFINFIIIIIGVFPFGLFPFYAHL